MSKHEADRQKALLFQKVAIFVDAENIELSGWKHHNGRTDYKKILDKVGDREILRILYYKPIYKEISNTFSNFWAGLGGEIRRPKECRQFLDHRCRDPLRKNRCGDHPWRRQRFSSADVVLEITGLPSRNLVVA